MRSQYNAKRIAEQLLSMVTLDNMGRQHYIIHETGLWMIGVAKSFSNHTQGRLKIHLVNGQTASWRLPQNVIDEVASIVIVQGNNGKGFSLV